MFYGPARCDGRTDEPTTNHPSEASSALRASCEFCSDPFNAFQKPPKGFLRSSSGTCKGPLKAPKGPQKDFEKGPRSPGVLRGLQSPLRRPSGICISP